MKPSETLRAAKVKISEPSRWTTRTYAKNVYGCTIYSHEEDAVCFCSIGAVQVVTIRDRCNWDTPGVGPMEIIQYLTNAIDNEFKKRVDEEDTKKGYTVLEGGFSYGYVSRYNDSHSHSEVMVMWDRAIELAEAEEGL